jgi:protein SCO1/2
MRTPAAVLAAAAAALLVLAGAYLALLGGPAAAGVGGPFVLTGGDGRQVTDRMLRGRYAVLYFGYTHCGDVCPQTLASLAAALDSLGPEADRVQAVFVSVDPARDTPEVMRAYTQAISPRLVGLTGTGPQVRDAARAYRVSAVEHRAGPEGYSIDHGSVLYLMGPDGRFVAPIRADESAPEIAEELRRHLG